MFGRLRLVWLFARVSMQDAFAYRVDFVVHLVLSVLQLVGELLGLWTIFSNTRSLAGWNVYQILALSGVYRIMAGTIGMTIAPNMRQIMEDIRDGRLDFVLIRPINSQFYVSIRRVVIWRLFDILIGLLVAGYAGLHLATSLSAGKVVLFLLMLAAGVIIIYSFWLVLATCAFWFTRINNIEMVFWNVFEAGRYPVDIYRPWIRWGLTYVVPLAFLTTFPAGALVGKTHLSSVTAAVILAGLAFAGASLFWRYGLRRYSGASA